MAHSHHSPMTFQEMADKLDQFDMDRKRTGMAPSDLAKSIILESAELLEFYQRDDTLKNRDGKTRDKNSEDIENEVADILIYLMKFCREANIDIVKATLKKLEKVGKKYPVDYKEKWGHDEYLRIKQEYRNNK